LGINEWQRRIALRLVNKATPALAGADAGHRI
jgi:hypothetical protein